MKPKPDSVTWEPTAVLRFKGGILQQYWECRTEKFFLMNEDGYDMEYGNVEYTGEWRKVPSEPADS